MNCFDKSFVKILKIICTFIYLYICIPPKKVVFLLLVFPLTSAQVQTGFKRKIADISGIKQVQRTNYKWACKDTPTLIRTVL